MPTDMPHNHPPEDTSPWFCEHPDCVQRVHNAIEEVRAVNQERLVSVPPTHNCQYRMALEDTERLLKSWKLRAQVAEERLLRLYTARI